MGAALATIAAFSTIGIFIDFLLGKGGQKQVRDRLETWWIRMSYVDWKNFGSNEAQFTAAKLQELFGKTLSFRRFIISISLFLYLAVRYFVQDDGSVRNIILRFPRNLMPLIEGPHIIYSIILFNISISITILSTKMGAKLLNYTTEYLNFMIFIVAVVLQYFTICYGSYVFEALADPVKYMLECFIWGEGL